MKTFREAVIDKNKTNNDGYSELEEEQEDINIILLTGSKSDDTELVVGQMIKTATQMKQKASKVVVGCAWVADFDLEAKTMVIMNYEDTGKNLKIQTDKTVVIVRAGAFTGENSEIGRAMIQAFQESGCFMLNDLKSSVLCDNKFLSYIAFSRNNIPIPRTALIPTEKTIENAHERIGGKFPVVIKTLSGTQGIGVSIVDSMQSMVSVIQSLKKYNADLLIQEHIKLKYDVRTIVLGGRIIASTRRNKVPDDFRSNAHLGATTEPYILNDKEQKTVKAAARVMGGQLVGVDHCIVDNEIFVLECNASPGITSNYHNYDITTVPQKNMADVGKTEDIYKTIINYLRYPSNRNLTSFRECGFLEQVLIKECGTVIGKFDTGNGTKASMKKVDKVEVEGNKVKWELHGKKYIHKLEGWSKPITSDAERTPRRPIILVDMEFNNKTYLNIPISLDLESTSDFLVNRKLMETFKVSVNPAQKFLLSEWRAT
jgi:ribosomal protein S6--L-glutamate ligase